jgi:hypothetical protein
VPLDPTIRTLIHDSLIALALFGYVGLGYLSTILLGRELFSGYRQWRARRRRAPR